MKRKYVLIIGGIVIALAVFKVVTTLFWTTFPFTMISSKPAQVEPTVTAAPVVNASPPANSATSSSSFNYASYKPISQAEFNKRLGDFLQEHKDYKGLSIFSEKMSLTTQLSSFPVPVQEAQTKYVQHATRLSGIPKSMENLFTHVYTTKFGEHELIFIFQDPLIPYLKKEYVVGKPITLYLIWSYTNTFPKEPNQSVFLVNEFKVD